MGRQVGIPLFYLQGMGGGAVLKFRDLFNDASIFWGWEQDKGEFNGASKVIQEINGQMLLSCLAGAKAYWDNNYCEAPKVFIGASSYPCEIITRLDEVTTPINNETLAGLFISKSPSGYGSKNCLSIGRCRKDSAALDGLAVMQNSYVILSSNSITTLPVWLRMRVGSGTYDALLVYFDYSLDGVNWINMYVYHGQVITEQAFQFNPPGIGLYVVNGINMSDGGTTNGIHGKFDHFIMRPRSIN